MSFAAFTAVFVLLDSKNSVTMFSCKNKKNSTQLITAIYSVPTVNKKWFTSSESHELLTTCLKMSAVVGVCCLLCFFAFSMMGGAAVLFKGT